MVKSATTQHELTPKLRAGLREHRREVERLRGEIGDVQAALSAFVRDVFDPSAFDPEPVQPDQRNGQTNDDDDEELVGW